MLVAAAIALPVLAHADAAFDAVAQARRQCTADAPPLRAQPQLDAAAARLAGGASLAAALQASGYRARRSFEWRLSGYTSPQAVTDWLARNQCATLRAPDLAELGVARSGTSYWIIAAAPFEAPAQADARGVATQVLALVNAARAQPRHCGGRPFAAAGPVALDDALARAATAHAASMAQGSYLEHDGRDGSTPAQRISRAGYDWRSVGENIAMGQPTPALVMQDWLRSPEHCANIMEPAFTQMGVAFAVNRASEGGIYWAQEFGRPR